MLAVSPASLAKLFHSAPMVWKPLSSEPARHRRVSPRGFECRLGAWDAALQTSIRFARAFGWRVYGINPGDFFRRLGRCDVQIHNHRILPTSDQHTLERLVAARVDFLVRNVRWDIDEITRSGFGNVFQSLAPPHARSTLHDEDDTLDFSMVMGPRSWHSDESLPYLPTACLHLSARV